MAISIVCPACQRAGQVPDQYAGQTIRCPKCKAKFPVPGAGIAPILLIDEPAPSLSQSEPSGRCPYCSEEIQATAKKCKHCGEWLDPALRAEKREPPPVAEEFQITADHDVCGQGAIRFPDPPARRLDGDGKSAFPGQFIGGLCYASASRSSCSSPSPTILPCRSIRSTKRSGTPRLASITSAGCRIGSSG